MRRGFAAQSGALTCCYHRARAICQLVANRQQDVVFPQVACMLRISVALDANFAKPDFDIF